MDISNIKIKNYLITIKFNEIDGIFGKFLNTKCQIIFAEKQKVNIKWLELNKIDHKAVYAIKVIDNNKFNIIFIGNCTKYNDFAYEIQIILENANNGNFTIKSLNSETYFEGGGIVVMGSSNKKKNKRSCYCEYCASCIVNFAYYQNQNDSIDTIKYSNTTDNINDIHHNTNEIQEE